MESLSRIQAGGQKEGVLCGKSYHSGRYLHRFLFWDFLKRFSQDTGHFDNGVIEGQRGIGGLWKEQSCNTVHIGNMDGLEASKGQAPSVPQQVS